MRVPRFARAPKGRAAAVGLALSCLAVYACGFAGPAAVRATNVALERPVTAAKHTTAHHAATVAGGNQARQGPRCTAGWGPCPFGLTLPSGTRNACGGALRPMRAECSSLVRTSARNDLNPAVADALPAGWAPAGLRRAYSLTTASAGGGNGQTVAVVDAYDDPRAEADLATYRAEYGLPACTTANGCFSKVNQAGQAGPLPAVDSTGGWEFEESLDVEMVSAICPNCHIMLVEANSNLFTDLGAAMNTAVARGARFVSDSWNGGEFFGESALESQDFNHPGVAITVAAGDGGYGTGWPSSSQFVTSVGGTSLHSASNTRGFTETAWSATGSGCAMADPKPVWQRDNSATNGCLNRTENDVAAVADPGTAVAVYDSYPYQGTTYNWTKAGGTSVATPIIAAVYALAGAPAPGTYPAAYPYEHTSSFYGVTRGSNGTCEPARAYLCQAGSGYDGPTGWGSPHGTAGFANSPASNPVTVPDPGTQDSLIGTAVNLAIQPAVDAAGTNVSYSASGLPAGLSIDPGTGTISGTVTGAAGTSNVTITAGGSDGAAGSISFRWVTYQPFSTSNPASGRIVVTHGAKCLDDPGFRTADGTRVDLWTCNGGGNQRWTVEADGTVQVLGKCLDVAGGGTANGTPVDLLTCNGSGSQKWRPGPGGQLYNPQTGNCLDEPGFRTANGTLLDMWSCVYAANEAWTVPVGPVVSAVAGTCMDDPGAATASGTQLDLRSCIGGSGQSFTLVPDVAYGDVQLKVAGKCLYAPGTTDGAAVAIDTCSGSSLAEQWVTGPDGEIASLASGKCVAAPGTAPGNGTKLVLGDCYRSAGETWHIR